MEFKIDTKETFSTITPPDGPINAKMTGELLEFFTKMRQSGSHNFIVDLSSCTSIDNDAVPQLVMLHEDSYSQDQSLVFTGLKENVMNVLKKTETDLLINIAPKMIEAIDIVSMEILERDLFGEE
jgi:anti-anti-sigma regulatory factor